MFVIILVVIWGVFVFIFVIFVWEKIILFWNVFYIFGFFIVNCLFYVLISCLFCDEVIRDYFVGVENWVFVLIILECMLLVILIFLFSLGIWNKFWLWDRKLVI